jgi:hypothetical protein
VLESLSKEKSYKRRYRDILNLSLALGRLKNIENLAEDIVPEILEFHDLNFKIGKSSEYIKKGCNLKKFSTKKKLWLRTRESLEAEMVKERDARKQEEALAN